MREGLSFLRSNKVLLLLSIYILLLNLLQATVHDQLVLLAKDVQRASDLATGLLFSFETVGLIVGAILATRLGKARVGHIVIGASIVHGLAYTAMGMVKTPWAAMPIWAAAAVGEIVMNINTTTLRQTIVPPRLMGRVSSITTMFANVPVPIANVAGGIIVERWLRIDRAFVGAGLASIVLALAFLATSVGRARLSTAEAT